jgi:probable rRNA maturation factor
LSIRIFYENTDYRLNGSGKTGKIIEKVIGKFGKISGDLSFIFTDDETLGKINIEFLKHDYLTDVITFNYNEGSKINGEVYISIDTVKYNSVNYNVSLREEILRVMLHGVLHLLGYDDQSNEERERIRKMEDRMLQDFNTMWNEL